MILHQVNMHDGDDVDDNNNNDNSKNNAKTKLQKVRLLRVRTYLDEHLPLGDNPAITDVNINRNSSNMDIAPQCK